MSLGIETLGGVCTKLIDRNTTIPTKKSQVFSTAADGQSSVEIHVLQGEREMAADNKTLGRFVLSGIAAAPRGVPQIEVAFDIDANGIVNVSAKDKGTGNEQKVTITASSNLSDDEIDKAVKEAERFSDEDKKHKEEIEAKNNADSLVYNTEKSLKDMGDKIDSADKEKVEAEVAATKKALESNDADTIKAATEKLTQVSYDVFGKVYQQQAQQQQAQGGGAAGGQRGSDEGDGNSGSTGENQGGDDDNVVDADYEVVDDDEEKDKKEKK